MIFFKKTDLSVSTIDFFKRNIGVLGTGCKKKHKFESVMGQWELALDFRFEFLNFSFFLLKTIPSDGGNLCPIIYKNQKLEIVPLFLESFEKGNLI